MNYRLEEIFDLQMGKTPSRNNPAYWQSKDNKWISIADLTKSDKYIENTKEYISDKAVEESGISLIPANTVIMSFKLSIGKTAITTEPMYSNEAIMSFRDKHLVDLLPDYIYYLLSGKKWEKDTNKAVMGKTLNKATLSNVIVNIDNINKQKEIVSRLDELNSIIANRKKELQKLPIIEDYNDVSEFLENDLPFSRAVESMMVTYNCNLYGKILLNKCLSSREVKYLSTLNPYFAEEHEMYNKKIDLEFIKNQMQEYHDHYQGDPTQAYIEASAFLFDLYKTNKEEATDIFNELFTTDLGIYSSDYEDETTLKIGSFVMRRDLLAQMFKEYYEHEVKRYGLNMGEEDEL